VGSINFAAGSLDGRRELAIEVRDATVVDRLPKSPHTTGSIRIRWISRRGLLADLDRVEGAAELLAIENKRTDADD